MPLQFGTKMMSMPLKGDFALNFNDDDLGQSSSNNHSRFPRKTQSIDGPQWSHQKSFYPEETPRSYASSHTPSTDYTPPQRSIRSPSVNRNMPARKTPSLSDNVDLFVDDKFFKTHNMQFGPAVISINEDHNGPSFPGGSSKSESESTNFGYRPSSSAGFSQASPPSFGNRSNTSSLYSHYSANTSSSPSSPKPTPNAFSYGKIPPRATSSHDYDRRPASSMASSQPSYSQERRSSYSSTNSGSSAGTIVAIGNPHDFEQRTISFSFDPEKRLVKSDGTLVDSFSHPGLRI